MASRGPSYPANPSNRKRPSCVLLTIAALAAIAAPSAAQGPGEACEAVGQVTVGQWAEYRLTASQAKGGTMQMRLAIIGTEAVNGKDHYWHEMALSSEQGSMIMQLLVPSYPYDQGDIAVAVMKAGDQPAMKMPKQMLGMMQGAAGGSSAARRAAESCNTAEVVGTESVQVPAGSFETTHLRSTGEFRGDVWVARGVPFGMVKMLGGGGEEMVLLGHGSDATSSIKETPREIR